MTAITFSSIEELERFCAEWQLKKSAQLLERKPYGGAMHAMVKKVLDETKKHGDLRLSDILADEWPATRSQVARYLEKNVPAVELYRARSSGGAIRVRYVGTV